MKFYNRLNITVGAAILILVLMMPLAAVGTPANTPAPFALMRLNLDGPPGNVPLPIYAVLQDAGGVDYVLVLAPVDDGLALGATVIDATANDAGYIVALERRTGAREAAATVFPILLDDGRHIVVPDAPGRADQLAEMGFDLGLFSHEPWILATEAEEALAPSVTWDPRVDAIMTAVTQTAAFNFNGNLSGENQVTIEGSPYTIVSRHTSSGTPIQKATQYVYEFLSQYALDVSFHNWSSGRNVIGEKLGATDPDEIVLITAHLDDMPSGGIAPGADDNGSGSVGVMLAAQLFDQYWFKKTIRFVFFTGEEQGLLGSQAYAAKVYADGDNIVGVYNMDMIGFDDVDGPTLRIHTRPSNSADLQIANTFVDVVNTYGLSGVLTPIIDQDGITASDHAAFWAKGYAGVLAIEDDQSDFNAYYHTVNDTRAHINLAYFTNYIKASLGSVAHMAIPTIAPCNQNTLPVGFNIDLHQSASTSSNLNGILERSERVMMVPTWHYPGDCSPAYVTGTVTDFSGPGSIVLSAPDDGATYGLMVADEVTNCFDEGGNCYELWVSPIGTRPSAHVDLVVTEELDVNRDQEWTVHLGESFTDVAQDYWAYPFVETILHNEITAGCDDFAFCPENPVTRAQMAVFLLMAMNGSGYTPPACSGVFSDVPCPGAFAVNWIEELASEGITGGCGGGDYCPNDPVTRAQMAVFLLAGKYGTGHVPAPCAGVFSDVPCPSMFADWIEELAAEGITGGCGEGKYCPGDSVTRAQMAVFLSATFDLSL
jgi:hypothetical protein